MIKFPDITAIGQYGNRFWKLTIISILEIPYKEELCELKMFTLIFVFSKI